MDAKLKLGLSVGVGLLLFGSGVYLAYSTYTHQSRADTAVDAVVLESDVEAVGRYDDNYRFSVRYAYSYEGTRYTSTNVYPGASEKKFDDEDEAREKARTYAAGNNVTAYVNPERPGKSYLIEADTGGTVLGSVVLVVLGLFATVLFGGSYLYRSLRPDPDEVSPDRHELRRQFEDTMGRIDDYPVGDYQDIRLSSIDPSTTFESNGFEMTIRDLRTIMESDPDPPCETPEELAEYLIEEMDEQGYFY
jgi:hypothetical protein